MKILAIFAVHSVENACMEPIDGAKFNTLYIQIMPHINIKCYPKHLSEQQMKSFVEDLTRLAEKHLKASEASLSIDFTEIPAERWKEEVYDKDIRPNMNHLAKKPGYEL